MLSVFPYMDHCQSDSRGEKGNAAIACMYWLHRGVIPLFLLNCFGQSQLAKFSL